MMKKEDAIKVLFPQLGNDGKYLEGSMIDKMGISSNYNPEREIVVNEIRKTHGELLGQMLGIQDQRLRQASEEIRWINNRIQGLLVKIEALIALEAGRQSDELDASAGDTPESYPYKTGVMPTVSPS